MIRCCSLVFPFPRARDSTGCAGQLQQRRALLIAAMSDEAGQRRWPAWVYGVGDDPDPRFSLANERTFRLDPHRPGLRHRRLGISALAHALATGARFIAAAVVLLCCGVLCGVTGLTRWARNERSMRLGVALARPSVLPMLTVILLLIAGLAAFALLS